MEATRAIVRFTQIQQPLDFDFQAGLFKKFPPQRSIEEFIRALASAGEIPQRRRLIRIPRRDEQDPALAFEDAGAEMDARRGA
jgi:hypothetical protein